MSSLSELEAKLETAKRERSELEKLFKQFTTRPWWREHQIKQLEEWEKTWKLTKTLI